MDERRLDAESPRGFEKVEGADGVNIEIIEGYSGREVVGRLGGGVDDNGGLELFHEPLDTGAVTNIQFVVGEALQIAKKPLLIPPSIALRTEENFALIVVHTMDVEAIFVEK